MTDKSENNGKDVILRQLAEEINDMPEEERFTYLRGIVQEKLGGDEKLFWSKIARKILLNEKLCSKTILEELTTH